MANPSPRLALVYARISQDRTGAGLGVDRQITECRALAERLGWRVVGVHTDNDISAYSGKPRPGYRALLADLEAGKATGVLAWHNDRLHRSPVELEGYIGICDPRDVITHTVMAGELDLSTPDGRMQARITGAVARRESEHKSARLRSQRRQLAESGGWHGGARPFGFEADGLTHRPAEAEVIRKATEAVLAGTTLRSVVREANASGLLTTFKREAWSILAFRNVLLRPRNAGLRTHKGEIIGEAVWEPIVEREQWDAMRAILTDPNRKTTPGNRIKWLGSGLYLCGLCGARQLRVGLCGGKRAPAYRCRQPGKGHVTRAAPPLDEYVSAVIVERLSRPDAVKLLRPATPGVDLDALRATAMAARTRLDEIAADYGSGVLTRGQMLKANEAARKRLETAESALTEATIPSPLDGLAGAPNVAEIWEGLDLGRRRAVLDVLMDVTVLPRGSGRTNGGEYFDTSGVKIEWK